MQQRLQTYLSPFSPVYLHIYKYYMSHKNIFTRLSSALKGSFSAATPESHLSSLSVAAATQMKPGATEKAAWVFLNHQTVKQVKIWIWL